MEKSVINLSRLTFALIILATLVYRYSLLHASCLEWDELYWLVHAKLDSVQEIIRVITDTVYHPPTYAVFLHYWVRLFGDSDFWARNFTGAIGILGLATTYLLAKEITGNKRIALITLLISCVAPLLIKFSTLVTVYNLQYLLILLSWFLLLKLLQADTPVDKIDFTKVRWNRPTFFYFAGYTIITVISAYIHAASVLFLMFQSIYLWSLRGKTRKVLLYALFILYGLIIASYIPYLIHVLDPKSLVWISDVHQYYSRLPFTILLLVPANFLFLRYAVEDVPANLPTFDILLLYSILCYALLYRGFKTIITQHKEKVLLILLLGIIPIVFRFCLSDLFFAEKKGVFQVRALLYTVFSLHLITAYAIDSIPHLKTQIIALICFVSLQLFGPFQNPLRYNGTCLVCSNLSPYIQPEDGFIIYPGWYRLEYMRYLLPEKFELTTYEKAMRQNNDNYFHTANQIDEKVFAISGEDLLNREDVKVKLKNFVTKKKRIWLFINDIRPFKSLETICGVTYLYPTTLGNTIQEFQTCSDRNNKI